MLKEEETKEGLQSSKTGRIDHQLVFTSFQSFITTNIFPAILKVLVQNVNEVFLLFIEDDKKKTRGSTLSSDVSGSSPQAPGQFHLSRRSVGTAHQEVCVHQAAGLPRLATAPLEHSCCGGTAALRLGVINCCNVPLPFSCSFVCSTMGSEGIVTT